MNFVAALSLPSVHGAAGAARAPAVQAGQVAPGVAGRAATARRAAAFAPRRPPHYTDTGPRRALRRLRALGDLRALRYLVRFALGFRAFSRSAETVGGTARSLAASGRRGAYHLAARPPAAARTLVTPGNFSADQLVAGP